MRFSIRDLLWLILLVAFGLGWWTNQRSALRQRREYQARVEAIEHELEATTAQMAVLRTRLESAKAAESALREELSEFVATQEDKLKIDVGPGFFRRLP